MTKENITTTISKGLLGCGCLIMLVGPLLVVGFILLAALAGG